MNRLPMRYRLAAGVIIVAAALSAMLRAASSESTGNPPLTTSGAASRADESPKEQTSTALAFERTTADLGHISEDDTPITAEFPFRNEGADPVVITQVRTTCGCTVPEYPREPIGPGGEGVIRITFHPKGHPGTLNRSVRICTASADRQAETLLRLTGEVAPTKDPYPHFAHRSGALRLMQRQVKFGKIAPGRPAVCRIHVVNAGDRVLKLSVEGLPPYMSFRCEPEQLAPGAEGDLCFRADPTQETPRGPFENLVLLMGSGTARPSDCSIRLIGEVF